MAEDGAAFWAEDGVSLEPSHFAERAALPIPAAGGAMILASLTIGGQDVVFGLVIGLTFLVPGILAYRAVRRSRLVVTSDGVLTVRLLREQPTIHLAHASAITRHLGIMRITVDGDPFVGQETIAVPISWWRSESAAKEVLRETARVSGCAVDPAAALVLGISARCEAGQELPPRMPTLQAALVLAIVATTAVGTVVHLVRAARDPTSTIDVAGGTPTEVVLVALPVHGWAHALAIAVPLSAALGLVLVWAWRRVPASPARTTAQWAGVILLFVIPMSAVVAWNASMRLVLHQRAVLAAWTLVLALTAAIVLISQATAGRWGRRSGPSGTTWGMLLFLVVAAAMTATVGGNLVGDVANPRIPLAGVVEHVGPPPPDFADTPRPPLTVVVDGEPYLAVGEARGALREGQHVRGEALARTRTIVRIEVGSP